MTGNGQLTRGRYIINDILRNPHFDFSIYPESYGKIFKLVSTTFWNNFGQIIHCAHGDKSICQAHTDIEKVTTY
mgnify:CR=1 FL=1